MTYNDDDELDDTEDTDGEETTEYPQKLSAYPVIPPPVSEFPETRITEEDEDEIFGVDEEDILGGDADFSDILSVSKEDILGRPPRPPKSKRMTRTLKHSPTPPPNMGGVQY